MNFTYVNDIQCTRTLSRDSDSQRCNAPGSPGSDVLIRHNLYVGECPFYDLNMVTYAIKAYMKLGITVKLAFTDTLQDSPCMYHKKNVICTLF